MDNFTEQPVKNKIINVMEACGAKGDGVTDDTQSILAALKLLGNTGGSLYFPPGTYNFSETISQTILVLI